MDKTVLVIDDSTTIRRLCDKELSNAGYCVLTAPTAEEGVALAMSERPDLIILDHQLPGKTGYEVACELLKHPETASIPVVASSTLRKKAYVEYVDCDNVVDMLPKPYTPEALIATIENAINTAAMVVQSQNDGSSVPEVIDELGESDMSGTFDCFSLREVLDMLNNGNKSGVLAVENERCRVSIYVDRGRIQAVTASGVDPSAISNYIPEGLAELAPVIQFTVAGRRGSEIDGLLGLLDSKVLDPRLLKKLLRIQAAVLLRFCFTGHPVNFRFDRNQAPPHLFQKLPLDGSLLSLLVEGALICEEQELPAGDSSNGYARKAIRGQNLDRAGLSSQHMKLMALITEPKSISQLATQLSWHEEEVRRVIHGFELAGLVESTKIVDTTKVFGVFTDTHQAQKVRSVFQQASESIGGKIVRDCLALRLLLRRNRPDVLLVELTEDNSQLEKLFEESGEALADVRLIGIRTSETPTEIESKLSFGAVFTADCTNEQLSEVLTVDSNTRLKIEAQANSSAATEPPTVLSELNTSLELTTEV